MSKYDLLNEEQKKAVFCTEGPLLILAGAGSGKTRVLTHRIAYLIEEKRVNPWNIMAITFTNKAAKEMRERVDHLISEGGQQVWVSTFHSSCVRILRKYGEKLGYDRYFTIYDTDDSKKIIRECMKIFNIDSKQYKEASFLGAINSAKNQGISPKAFEKQAIGDFRQETYARVYSLYQEKLFKSNALDFGDLLVKVVELFTKHPDVLEEYQKKFQYIMVDEYQDTNGIQFQLIQQLASSHKNLCVVGDDDQSIYKFRGADIGNILNFEKEYPNTKVIKLEENYRSTGNILEAANQVIGNNIGRKDKRLWTKQEEGKLITLRKLSSEKEEGQFVVDEIKKGKEEDGHDYKDFAILYRTNAQSRVLEENLVRENVPYRILGGVSFYQRREIKDVIAYLKVISNGLDDLAVKRIINVPRRGIGDTTIERVGKYAAENEMSFFDTLERAKEIPELSRSEKRLLDFHKMIVDFRTLPQGKNLVELFTTVLEKTEYKKALMLEGTDEAKDRLSNIDELLSKLTDYVHSHEEPSLNEFLEEVSLVADIDQYDENNNVVILMTLHSAKGLEFPVVFLTGMEDGLFPSYMSISSGNEEEIEEERRLCYVGITRAEKKLYLTYASSRMINGQTQYNNISRYVSEIPKGLIEKEESIHTKSEYTQPLSYARKNNPFFKSQPYQIKYSKNKMPIKEDVCIDYEAGDTVLHKTFGLGKVIKIEEGGKDYQVTVDFPSVGTKKLFAGLAGLKKS